MTRVCIFGLGAIGGYLAAELADAGVDVCGIARGAQLDAIRRNGLTLIAGDQRRVVRLRCTDAPAELGAQDFVFMTMKAHTAPAAATGIAALLGPATRIVTAYNGWPWWYRPTTASGAAPMQLDSVDPGGRLARMLGVERALGCVIYPAARVVGPGVIAHVQGKRLSLGEARGGLTARLEQVVAMLNAAGFDAAAVADLRPEIWLKLVANAAFNPVSVLTRATLGGMLDDAGVRLLLVGIMAEVIAIAQAYGVSPPLTPQQMVEVTRPFADHRTSMLQDLQAGRSLELDPIVGALTELARAAGVATPELDLATALARQCAREQGCYGTG